MYNLYKKSGTYKTTLFYISPRLFNLDLHSSREIRCFIFSTTFCRFFNFGVQAKKKISSISTSTTTSTSTPTTSILQQHAVSSGGSGSKRRESERSLSGSAHELAVCGVRDTTSMPRVPHSHSQSNLTDIPYR